MPLRKRSPRTATAYVTLALVVVVTLIVTATAAAAAFASAAPARDAAGAGAGADADVAAEIERLEQQLITAIEAKDFATYQRLVAEDYIAIGANGETTRAQAIESYHSGDLSLPGLKIGEIHVHVYGDTATINARTFGDRVEKGKTTPNRVRYMRVWIRRQGHWRAIAQMARPLESN
jgi:ketosteroid isomerase-like protein